MHRLLTCVSLVYACIWESWSWACARVRCGRVVLRIMYRRACLRSKVNTMGMSTRFISAMVERTVQSHTAQRLSCVPVRIDFADERWWLPATYRLVWSLMTLMLT